MDIVLYEPEIPQNTGTIARLCAGFKINLHLIEPLGYSLQSKYVKRAGLDYWEHVRLFLWHDFPQFIATYKKHRLIYTSSKCGVSLHHFTFTANDILIFGSETRGIPKEYLTSSPYVVTIPTQKTVRSLNLAVTAGIVLFQALHSADMLHTAI